MDTDPAIILFEIMLKSASDPIAKEEINAALTELKAEQIKKYDAVENMNFLR